MQNQKEKKLSLEEIQQVVDREILPMLHGPGGGLSLLKIEEDVLYFRLTGQCCGCPSAWLTAEEVVKGPLLERFPTLRDVVVDTDMDEEMVDLARRVLSGTFRVE